MAKAPEKKPEQDHGKRIDAIIAVLKANGLSLPKELE
jgi:hypothetical protein